MTAMRWRDKNVDDAEIGLVYGQEAPGPSDERGLGAATKQAGGLWYRGETMQFITIQWPATLLTTIAGSGLLQYTPWLKEALAMPISSLCEVFIVNQNEKLILNHV